MQLDSLKNWLIILKAFILKRFCFIIINVNITNKEKAYGKEIWCN